MRTLLLFIAATSLCLPSFAEDAPIPKDASPPNPPKKATGGFNLIEASPKQLTDFIIDYQSGTLAFKYNGIWLAFTPPEAKAAEGSIAVLALLSDVRRAKRIQLTYASAKAFWDDAQWADEKNNYNKVYRVRLFF